MYDAYNRYNTYPVRSYGSRRLAEAIGSNWMSVREINSRETLREEDDSLEDEGGSTPEEIMGPEYTEVFEAGSGTNDGMTSALTPGLPAYGCVYHQGAQRLIVANPGAAAPVNFDAHSCLNRIKHEAGAYHLTVTDAGDYEITFFLSVSAKASAPVAFELRVGETPLPGGTFAYLLPMGVHECRGGTMARMHAGDCISLVMTSVSVCEATLASGGVSAMLSIKKLG